MSGSLDVLYPILLALALGILLMRVGIYCLMVSDKLVIIFFGIPIMLRYESITSIQVRGLLGLFRAEYIGSPTWILASRFWGPKIWIETNEGLVRRFVISPLKTDAFERELRSRVDQRVRQLEALRLPAVDQAPSPISAK